MSNQLITRTRTRQVTEEKPIAMKVMDLRESSSERAYLTKLPSETHSKAELEALHRAIQYTKAVKQEESLAKMDEEELITHSLSKSQLKNITGN